jgi:HSP20 family protein
VTHEPPDPLRSLQCEVERLFHDLVFRQHPASHFAEPRWAPAADLVVAEHSARVIFELAGVPREGVKLLLRGNVLEVSGRRSPPQEQAGTRYHRAEIYFGDFRRVVEIPWEADPSRIEAVYRDGMLEVRLHRVPEPERREISIEEPEAR